MLTNWKCLDKTISYKEKKWFCPSISNGHWHHVLYLVLNPGRGLWLLTERRRSEIAVCALFWSKVRVIIFLIGVSAKLISTHFAVATGPEQKLLEQVFFVCFLRGSTYGFRHGRVQILLEYCRSFVVASRSTVVDASSPLLPAVPLNGAGRCAKNVAADCNCWLVVAEGCV